MEQILGNLVGNALTYGVSTPPGRVSIKACREGRMFRFDITDDGPGIAEEHQRVVFEPFRRFAPQDVPGEGVGLAFVQRLVRRHGGQIWCTSTPGHGATFSFTIADDLTGAVEAP
jgi:signal transduction histidine kinase